MREHIPTRRRLLRAALVTGCGIWIPLALAVEEPKKATASSPKPAPSPTKKVPQASVQYQTKPKGEQKCSNCMNFIAESNTCKLVEGSITPEGWCKLWVQKA
jgi:hypothetical protein